MAGYLGNVPVPQATQTRDRFVATAGQTSFATSGYTAGYLDVFLNGVKLDTTDFTAINGSDVVLASGASADDVVEVVAYSTFEVLNQTFSGDTAVTGNFTVDGSVGIGTNTPTQHLDVHAASGGHALAVTNSGTDNNSYSQVYSEAGGYTTQLFQYGGGPSYIQTGGTSLSFGTISDAYLQVKTNNQERMLFGTAGFDPYNTATFRQRPAQDGFCSVSFDGGSGGGIPKIDATSSNDFNIYTNNALRVGIDSAGRVTMPYQPAFCANGGAYRSGGSREVLQFTSVIANVGNHYNASTYTFTAPVSGNYRFSFSLMTYQGGHSRCQFTKNGSSVGNQFYSDTVDNGEYSRNCGEIIVYLAAGDTMRVDRNVSNESGEIVHVDYRHFAGQLIG